jgi:hypothetical protein
VVGTVGEMLGFGPIAAEGPGTLAELAFDYAAGPRLIDPWFPAPSVFRWDWPRLQTAGDCLGVFVDLDADDLAVSELDDVHPVIVVG